MQDFFFFIYQIKRNTYGTAAGSQKIKVAILYPLLSKCGFGLQKYCGSSFEYLLCARHSTSTFTYIVSFNLCNNTVIISSSLQAGEVKFPEQLNDFPKIIQLSGHGAIISPVFLSQSQHRMKGKNKQCLFQKIKKGTLQDPAFPEEMSVCLAYFADVSTRKNKANYAHS